MTAGNISSHAQTSDLYLPNAKHSMVSSLLSDELVVRSSSERRCGIAIHMHKIVECGQSKEENYFLLFEMLTIGM